MLRGRARAFTLIEISIVLVIIGLIAGGVLAGRTLVRSASVRSVVTAVEQYKTGVNTFYSRVGYLPGDVPKTEAAAQGLTARYAFAGFGDGNGLIEGCGADSNVAGCENILFWQDLAAKRLINFSYNPSIPDSTPPAALSYLPSSSYAQAYQLAGNILRTLLMVSDARAMSGTIDGTYSLASFFPPSKVSDSTYFIIFSSQGKNFYQLTGITYVDEDGNYTLRNTITPSIANAIDSKIDDGLPLSGGIKALDGLAAANSGPTPAATACVNTDTPNHYNLAPSYENIQLCQLAIGF